MDSSCRLPGCAAGAKIHIHLYKYAHMQHARHTRHPRQFSGKKGGEGRREESLSCMRIVSRRARAKDYRAKPLSCIIAHARCEACIHYIALALPTNAIIGLCLPFHFHLGATYRIRARLGDWNEGEQTELLLSLDLLPRDRIS